MELTSRYIYGVKPQEIPVSGENCRYCYFVGVGKRCRISVGVDKFRSVTIIRSEKKARSVGYLVREQISDYTNVPGEKVQSTKLRNLVAL